LTDWFGLDYDVAMTYAQLIRRWGTQEGIAAALRVSQPTVSTWVRIGVPAHYQFRVEVLTDGELRVDQKYRWKAPPIKADSAANVGG
jgi:hypothetical protein